MFAIDLLPMALRSFDVVVGMDWLSVHLAEILCSKKMIKVSTTSGGVVMIYGEKTRKINTVVTSLKAQKCLAKGCSSYFAYVIDTKLEKKGISDVEVVREFSDVFPEDLPGLPPEPQVEFHIDSHRGRLR